MATFRAGNKQAANRGVGPSIVKLAGKPGYYLRWYEKRESIQVLSTTARCPHGLTVVPGGGKGVLVMAVAVNSPYQSIVGEGDIIIDLGGIPVNSTAELLRANTALKGTIVKVKVNKSGKSGTTPRFKKAGRTREQAAQTLGKWKEIKEMKAAGRANSEIRFSQLVDEFLVWMATPQAGYAKSWRRDIKRIMLDHRNRWGGLTLAQVTPKLVSDWFNRRSSEVAASTLVNEISPLRKAFKLAVRTWKYLENDPTRDISFRQRAARIPKAFSDEQLAVLLAVAMSHDERRVNPPAERKSGERTTTLGQSPAYLRTNRYNSDGTFDTARLRFLFLTALRKSQFIDLKWGQYNEKKGTLTLSTTDEHSEKSRRVNVLPLPKAAVTIIQGQPKNSDYIFPNLAGGRDVCVFNRLRRIFSDFEHRTHQHATIHMMRHTGLTQLLRHSQNIAAVSKYAGHADIKTTEIYAHVLDQQMKEITADFDITAPQQPGDEAAPRGGTAANQPQLASAEPQDPGAVAPPAATKASSRKAGGRGHNSNTPMP